MKFFQFGVCTVGALALMFLAAGCATTGQTAREGVMASAGFHQVSATTPQQKALLAQLTANTFSRVSKDGASWFVFPNHATSSAMVGTAANYQEYLRLARVQYMPTIGVNTLPVASWNGFGGPRWGWGSPTRRVPVTSTSAQTRL